jgi:glc operon protein GlcG
MQVLQGGVPIKLAGKVIGAIGVSGDTPQIDEAIAIEGSERLQVTVAAVSC